MKSPGRHILAAALFVSGSVLLAAWQLAPAILMAGKNYGNTGRSFTNFRFHLGMPLLIPACLAFLGAIAILLSILANNSKPDNE
jgi:hypothetical protein